MEAVETSQHAGVVHPSLGVGGLVLGEEREERLRAVGLVAEREGLAGLTMEAAHEAISGHIEGPLRGNDGEGGCTGVGFGGYHL